MWETEVPVSDGPRLLPRTRLRGSLQEISLFRAGCFSELEIAVAAYKRARFKHKLPEARIRF